MSVAIRRTLAALMGLSLVAASGLLAQRRGGDSGGDRRRPTSSGAPPSQGSSPAPRSSAAPASRGSQASAPPRPGKIAAIRDAERAARSRVSGGAIVGRGVFLGGCWECDYWGWYHGYWGWYHGGWWYPSDHPYYSPPVEEPAMPGQGYLAYPYAEGDRTDQTFVRAHARDRAGFGALSAQYFEDRGSTTRAGHVTLEGAIRSFRGELEYGYYEEPTASGTDRLHTFRAGLGLQPRLGNRAYLVAGLAARGLVLDNGSVTVGPEGELGLQVFPWRPYGVSVTGRLAGLTWNGHDYFALRELNTTGSIFFGRLELDAGWHWLKVGGSPAFGGPMLGTRLWF